MNVWIAEIISVLLFLTLIISGSEENLVKRYESICGVKEKNVSTIYNHTEQGFLINGSSICNGEVFLLCFLQSKPDHFHRRNIIRSTWGSLRYVYESKVQVVFFLGLVRERKLQSNIEAESEMYGDIIQANFLDSYRNLTYKHLYALRWITEYCPRVHYVSKSDDDTLLNIPNIVSWLKSGLNRKNFIYGHKKTDEKPIRQKGIKWTVSRKEWKSDKYPIYAKGFAYFLSGDVISKLWYCSFYVPYFWIDDVYIGEVARFIDIDFIDFNSNHGFTGLRNHLASALSNNYAVITGGNQFNEFSWRLIWRYIITNMVH